MKKIFLLSIVCFAASGVFAQQQKIQVESDKALNVEFSKFKTFAFSSMIDSNLETGVYFLNDLVFKSQLREAIQEEMMGLGYKMDKENADLIVNFRVFEKPATLKGFDGYGNSYWSGERYRQISDQATYDVKAGTLLVSLLDRKNAQVVWQGFASGLINNEKFIKAKATIREAVNLIMDEYGVRANSYTVK